MLSAGGAPCSTQPCSVCSWEFVLSQPGATDSSCPGFRARQKQSGQEPRQERGTSEEMSLELGCCGSRLAERVWILTTQSEEFKGDHFPRQQMLDHRVFFFSQPPFDPNSRQSPVQRAFPPSVTALLSSLCRSLSWAAVPTTSGDSLGGTL